MDATTPRKLSNYQDHASAFEYAPAAIKQSVLDSVWSVLEERECVLQEQINDPEADPRTTCYTIVECYGLQAAIRALEA